MNNDLISREALKKALKSNCDTLCPDKNTNWCEHCCPLNDFEDLIDNAPTVDTSEDNAIQYSKGYQDGFIEGKKLVDRPQGEWIIDIGEMVICPFCKERHCCKMNFCGNCGADMRGKEE